jgi:predicted metalloendopeptidase
MSVTDGSSDMFRGSGFWSKRTKCQKYSIIAVASAICLAVIIVCCVFLIPRDDICKSPVCEEEAQKILMNINNASEPCDDFYEFACGNFQNVHQIPQDKSRLATFDVVADKVTEGLKTVLDQIATDGNTTEPKPVQFISQFFHMCHQNNTDIEPLVEFVKDFGGWPIASIPNRAAYTWNETLLGIIGDLGEGVIIQVMVTPNPTNTSSYVLTVSYLLSFYVSLNYYRNLIFPLKYPF